MKAHEKITENQGITDNAHRPWAGVCGSGTADPVKPHILADVPEKLQAKTTEPQAPEPPT